MFYLMLSFIASFQNYLWPISIGFSYCSWINSLPTEKLLIKLIISFLWHTLYTLVFLTHLINVDWYKLVSWKQCTFLWLYVVILPSEKYFKNYIPTSTKYLLVLIRIFVCNWYYLFLRQSNAHVFYANPNFQDLCPLGIVLMLLGPCISTNTIKKFFYILKCHVTKAAYLFVYLFILSLCWQYLNRIIQNVFFNVWFPSFSDKIIF